MKIEEFFKAVGGDYNEVLSRLMNDKLILKFVVKFKSDNSYNLLIESFDNKDFKTSFRAVHTLKGVCSTLGFINLFKVRSDLTEILRNENEIDINNAETLLNDLKVEYFKTMELINDIN